MSWRLPRAGAPGAVPCSPASSVGPEPRSRRPNAPVSLIAALASLLGSLSPLAAPPALLLGALSLLAATPAQAQTTPKSTDATLSALEVSASDSADGTYTKQPVKPVRRNSSNTLYYQVNVAHDVTHVKVTATANHPRAGLRIGSNNFGNSSARNRDMTSGSASHALALKSSGETNIGITITPEAGNSGRRYISITIGRLPPPPGPPRSPLAIADYGALEVVWSPPNSGSQVTGYDLHYTDDFYYGINKPNEPVRADGDASRGWADAGNTGRETLPSGNIKQLISGLKEGRRYFVRVRARGRGGTSAWVYDERETERWVTVSIKALNDFISEEQTIVLYTSVDINVWVREDLTFPLIVNQGTAEREDIISWVDSPSLERPLRVKEPRTAEVWKSGDQGVFPTYLYTERDDDDNNDETFTLSIDAANLPDGFKVGRSGSVTITIKDDESFASPEDLAVTAGDRKLDLTWSAPEGVVAGYDVQYTSASDTTRVDINDWLHRSGNPANGWVDAGHSGTDESHTLNGLANGTEYRVRVRATGAGNAKGAWAAGSATPNSTDATLSGLTASSSTSADGSFSALNIGTFAPGTTSYTATVENTVTHVKLTPTVNDSNGSVTVNGNSVSSGSRSGAIALSVGDNEIPVLVTAQDGSTQTYTVTVTRQAQQQSTEPLTAAFENVPSEHDGTEALALDMRFSEALGETANAPAAASFAVKGGKVKQVQKVEPGLWRVQIAPKSWKDVTITLAGGRACGEAGAICTADGRAVSNTSSETVGGPMRIRIEGARAREGKDESLDFAVTLNRAASHEVLVDYATADETATAGQDYTAVSGTLVFAAGETAKTISVPVLDDAVDEGREVMRLLLSNPQGAYLRKMHSRARGIITNADPLPSAWQIRFGRSVSQQVVDALQQRFSSSTTTPSGLQLTLAGETVTGDTPLEENHVLLSRLLGFESVSGQELAQGSSFSFSPDGAGPRLSFWGKGAFSSFNGIEESITLTGDVTTAVVGAEWNTQRWQAGAALSHSWGNGSYQGEADGADGRISSSLTGIFPYGRYALTPRLGVWATAGYGWGAITLNPDGDGPEYNPATTMALGAVGMDGLLLDGGSDGVTLTTTADALFLKTSSEAVEGLESSEGNISRLRLGLEATRPFPLANGASLSPSLEVGLRQDSGDAETGFGMDLGAGLSWNDPEQGITATVKGRTLLSHGAEDFQDQGLALSFSWQPSPSNRGASLSLSHAVGLPAEGGMAALLNPTAIEVLDDSHSDGERFEARLAYGFPFYNDRLTLTPAVATALSPSSRSYSLLWSLAPYDEHLMGEPWQLSLEGERQENLSSSPTVDHSLKLRFALPL